MHRFSRVSNALFTVGLGLGVALTVCRPAFASPIAIDTTTCPSLDAAAIDRRVQLELADVARAQEGAGSLRITFACASTSASPNASSKPPGSPGSREVTVTISDPVTDKRVERRVPMPPAADRERVLALVASQLFVTSWLELLTHPSPEARPPPTNPPSPEAIERARDTAAEKADVSPSRIELAVGGVLDFRSLLDAPLRMAGAFVRPSFALAPHLRFELAGAFTVGQASRARGVIDATLGTFGVGLGYRSSQTARVTLDAHALVSLAYARVVGNATVDGATDATAHGLFVDLSLAAGPTCRLGPTTMSLELAGGIAVPEMRGSVAGDSDVRLSGLWMGARLSIGAGWGSR